MTTSKQSIIWIIGDSTASVHDDNDCQIPRMGFGEKIAPFLKPGSGYAVKNIAAPGRSSKSFPNTCKAEYNQFVSSIKDGDILILGFGHNDEKNADSERFSDPRLSSDYMGAGSSFKANLKRLYIDIAMEKGAKVILYTPIVRRSENNDYTTFSAHITDNGDYPQAIRDLADEYNPALPVIDMTEITKTLYIRLGSEKVGKLHANQSGTIDNTHTNDSGAEYIAYLLIKEIVTENIYGLGALFALPKATEIN